MGEVKDWIGYSGRRCAGISFDQDIACVRCRLALVALALGVVLENLVGWNSHSFRRREQRHCAPTWIRYLQRLPLLRIGYMRPFTSGLSLNISVVFLRFILCSRLRCSRPGCLPSCLSKASCASGGSRSKRSSSRHSSRPRQRTGPGLTPRPDRASLSPSTALPSKPPPPPRKIRPSWIHSLKLSIPLLLQTM